MPEIPAITKDPFLEACLPGNTKELLELKESIIRFNTQDDEVRAILLLGESGVGKTHLAKIIAMHRCWHKELFLPSAHRPPEAEVADLKQWYVRVRGTGILKECGEPFREVPLPILEGTLARSWLFGHKKGSFSGADKDHNGFLGEDAVTDVLLDEIGYASLDMQRTLLQVIQSGDFYKVGSTKKETTEARLIFATNQNLEVLVQKGDFQEDLWWRLTDHVLYIPPLRKHPEEVKTIALSLTSALNKEHIGGDGSGFLHLTKADLDWATGYNWPGNIRELEKTIRRWFFFRGTRPLKDVWTQIAHFIPRGNSLTARSVILNASELRAQLQKRIEAALSANQPLGSPEALLGEYVDPARNEIAQLLTSCIDSLELKMEQLKQLFPGIAESSIRPWLSRNRQ